MMMQSSLDPQGSFLPKLPEEEQLMPRGLTEETIVRISETNREPKFLLDWRLKAYRYWLTQQEPTWPNLKYHPINYQNIDFYVSPLDHLVEQQVLGDLSSASAMERLQSLGIVFCSFAEALIKHTDIVHRYLGTVVPYTDNFFAALNSSAFGEGTFCYIPKGVRCPFDLASSLRMKGGLAGQFARTLIVADEGSYVSYVERSSAPSRDRHQIHAGVVELVALKNAEIRYATLQNWSSGDQKGVGGIYNFVTKRGLCLGAYARISWTAIDLGSSISWNYPSVILQGDGSHAEVSSLTLTGASQQADVGTKMIHHGKKTKSSIMANAISFGRAQCSYRSLVTIERSAAHTKNGSLFEGLLLGSSSTLSNYPLFQCHNQSSHIDHRASLLRWPEPAVYGGGKDRAKDVEYIDLLVNRFDKDVLKKLPLAIATEAQRLITERLEHVLEERNQEVK